MKLWTCAGLLILGFALSGCAGIARGVTEAIMDDRAPAPESITSGSSVKRGLPS